MIAKKLHGIRRSITFVEIAVQPVPHVIFIRMLQQIRRISSQLRVPVHVPHHRLYRVIFLLNIAVDALHGTFLNLHLPLHYSLRHEQEHQVGEGDNGDHGND